MQVEMQIDNETAIITTVIPKLRIRIDNVCYLSFIGKTLTKRIIFSLQDFWTQNKINPHVNYIQTIDFSF